MLSLSFVFFAIAGAIVAFIDAKKEIIPDRIVLPSILILSLIIFFEKGVPVNNFLTALGVVMFFVILIYFFDDFGGGDIRFGALCGVFLGFPDIFIFFIIGGVLQSAMLLLLSKKTIGFAPAMYTAAILTSVFGNNIWELI